MYVCIFPFTAHGTVCTFVVHEYKVTRWTYFTMVQKSQIIVSKMFTTPGMYNYGANNILSVCAVYLISSWCFHKCDGCGSICTCVLSPPWDLSTCYPHGLIRLVPG